MRAEARRQHKCDAKDQKIRDVYAVQREERIAALNNIPASITFQRIARKRSTRQITKRSEDVVNFGRELGSKNSRQRRMPTRLAAESASGTRVAGTRLLQKLRAMCLGSIESDL